VKRNIAAVAVLMTAGLSLTAPAFASTSTTNSRCEAAKTEVTKAQAAYDTALSVASARAKAVGFTQTDIEQAKGYLADGKIDAVEQGKLLGLYAARDASKKINVATDVPKLKAVLDTRLALNAAIAAKNIECKTGGSSSTPSKSDATSKSSNGSNSSKSSTGSSSSKSTGPDTKIKPTGAPATGDGSTLFAGASLSPGYWGLRRST
jgi:hypothetical protein